MTRAANYWLPSHTSRRPIIPNQQKYIDDRFKDTPKRRERASQRAFGLGDGWASRLLMELEEPYFYSLHMYHLDLPETYTNPAIVFRELPTKQIIHRIKDCFIAPYYYKLEVSKGSQNTSSPKLHVHLIANKDAGLLKLPRDGQMIKPIPSIEDYERVVKYLCKPKLGDSEEVRQILDKERKRLARLPSRSFPRTSGVIWK